ncbi:hypothetical protein M378DRAFT_157483 [Amanita muscaria Koide BX008]|uniref:Uncharacterized protein n=1 Tax=Amanita muscaria (strain Koide BX008) TaxID=946122 RepID=A0A0C2XJH8_AMAMK|nr:hypothetical protein M378DRAFT_157483 [Amanita muscaria Koide BX008]
MELVTGPESQLHAYLIKYGGGMTYQIEQIYYNKDARMGRMSGLKRCVGSGQGDQRRFWNYCSF